MCAFRKDSCCLRCFFSCIDKLFLPFGTINFFLMLPTVVFLLDEKTTEQKMTRDRKRKNRKKTRFKRNRRQNAPSLAKTNAPLMANYPIQSQFSRMRNIKETNSPGPCPARSCSRVTSLSFPQSRWLISSLLNVF